MTVPALREVPSNDRAVQAVWAALGLLRAWLAGRPVLDHVEVEGWALATGTNLVPHGLGRRPRGWWVTRRNAGADVYDSASPSASPERTLALEASAPVTVNLVVY